MKKKVKFIFVTGGVVSSLGKGIASASLGAILEARGQKITMIKLAIYNKYSCFKCMHRTSVKRMRNEL